MDNAERIRKLTINAFHIREVVFGAKTRVQGGVLTLNSDLKKMVEGTQDEWINKARLNVITPSERNIPINSIMDIQPIASKVLGVLGEGLTHVLTGVVVMINGVDVNGRQASSFGCSDGILAEQVVCNRRGTPSDSDLILQLDVEFKENQGLIRSGVNAAYHLCDRVVQDVRDALKRLTAKDADEKHVYYDIVRRGKPRVLIVKQVAGQGGGYDTRMFGREPAGFEGGRSIVDMGNVPMIVTPNEYRDGALMCLY